MKCEFLSAIEEEIVWIKEKMDEKEKDYNELEIFVKDLLEKLNSAGKVNKKSFHKIKFIENNFNGLEVNYKIDYKIYEKFYLEKYEEIMKMEE